MQQNLKQSLAFCKSTPFHCPKVDVRLPAGDNKVGLHGVEDSAQHWVIGTLQKKKSGYLTQIKMHSSLV